MIRHSLLTTFIKFKIFLIINLFILNNVTAQNTDIVYDINDKDIKSISFIKSFPDNLKSAQKNLINYLVGKNDFFIVKPMSLYAENINNLIVSDTERGKILNIKNNVGQITRFKQKNNAELISPIGICKISDNEYAVCDSKLNNVYRFSTENKTITPLSENTSFSRPTGIAYSEKNQKIYVVETASHQISILDKNGNLLKKAGKRGTKKGEFNFPSFICVDNLGMLYVVDSMNFRIQMLDQNGEYINSFGENGNASGYFAAPKGIAVDRFGNIYVADAMFNVVQIFDNKGNFLFSFGEKGSKTGEFNFPEGVFIDKENYLYVADSFNSRIQIYKINTID